MAVHTNNLSALASHISDVSELISALPYSISSQLLSHLPRFAAPNHKSDAKERKQDDHYQTTTKIMRQKMSKEDDKTTRRATIRSAPRKDRYADEEKEKHNSLLNTLLPRFVKNVNDGGSAGELERDDGFEGASAVGAVFNLSTTIVGAGIMALPAIMKVVGLVPGLVMIALAALFTRCSIHLLLKCKPAASYSDAVGGALCQSARVLLQICIVVNNLGVLIVYMIIIGDVFSGAASGGVQHSGVLQGWFGQQWWTGRATTLLLTCLFVLAPLVSVKRIDSLRYTSALSVALAVIFVAIMTGVAVIKLMDGTVDMPRLFPKAVSMASLGKLFTVVPVLVTAYICHYSVHPIERELKDSSQMKRIVDFSLILCCILYMVTSFFGFLLFGEQTLEDVLANFDTDLHVKYGSILDDTARISYALHLILVFPIVFYSLRLIVDGLLCPCSKPSSPFLASKKNGLRFFPTSFLMTIIYVGANYIPNIWDAFQFTGATASVCIGFIFPAAIALRDPHGVATRIDKTLAWLMIIISIFSSTFAISSDIYDKYHTRTEARFHS